MTPGRSSLALSRIALLEGLSPARLDALAQRCRWQNVPAGKSLLVRSEAFSDVYFLVAGRLRVTTYATNGRQVTFRDSTEGEYFGDIAAIDGKPRSADVVTLSPCVVAVLDPAGFLDLLREEPAVALRVMRGLAARVRELSERVIDLSTVGVPQRLHAALLRLAQAAGVVDNRARIDPLPTHLELANQISTAREQVTRELGVLARSGVVVKDGRALVVLDVHRLQGLIEAPAPIPTIGR